MKIVLLNGGLGNQMFQIFFGIALAQVLKEDVIFDDSYFDLPSGVSPHGNKANAQRRLFNKVFGINLNLLSNHIAPDRWKNILLEVSAGNTSIPELLDQFSPPFTLFAETQDYLFSGKVLFPRGPEWMNSGNQSNAYYHGYWICKNYFDQVKTALALTFPAIAESHNIAYMNELQNENSVCIHVRKFSNEGFNWDVPIDWYVAAISAIRQRVHLPHFYIFTDDYEWCNVNINQFGLTASDKFTFILGNEHEDLNYRDMQLMASCKHMIISNSSFSYLAALLNNSAGIKLNPTSRML